MKDFSLQPGILSCISHPHAMMQAAPMTQLLRPNVDPQNKLYYLSVSVFTLFIPEFSLQMREMILIPQDYYKDLLKNNYKEANE